jgi:hypothetical protein
LFSIAVITAISSFFRTVGGVFGIAIFGTYYENVLAQQLKGLNLPIAATALAQDFTLIKQLPSSLQLEVQEAFVYSLDKMRILIVPFAGIAFFISLLIEHHELRRRPGAKAPGAKGSQPDAVVTVEAKPEGEEKTPTSEKGEFTEQEYTSLEGDIPAKNEVADDITLDEQAILPVDEKK